jgi:1-acyl-sn-glycerol-3-phosphate acyltransferase
VSEERATVGDVVRSLVFYAVFYGGSVGYCLVAVLLLGMSPARFQRYVMSWSRFHRACTRRILGMRVVIEGELPRSGALVAVKHESFFEAIDAPNVLPMSSVIAKAELLRIPLWGRAARQYGLVGVEREAGAKALRTMLAEAQKRIDEGRLLVIFPEGTRVPHGQTAPLGSGFAGLYKLLKLPVVPIAIDSGPLYHRRWKRPGIITFRVGAAIAPGLPRDEVEAQVLAAINALNPARA